MGQYKLKNCKFCDKEHRKKGPYCSQSCANRGRDEYSPNVAEAMRKVAIEYNRTPEAIAKQKQINTSLASMTVEDFAVDIPDIRDINDIDWSTYDRADNWWFPRFCRSKLLPPLSEKLKTKVLSQTLLIPLL